MKVLLRLYILVVEPSKLFRAKLGCWLSNSIYTMNHVIYPIPMICSGSF